MNLTQPTRVDEAVEQRGAEYGPPSENHARTARLWNAYLASRPNVPLNTTDVCFLNILQKIARCMSRAGPSKDSLEDIQGFVENILIMHDMNNE